MNVEEKKDQELQAEYEDLAKRAAAKAKELSTAEAEVQRMGAVLVDAGEKDREKVIEQRAKSAALRDALAAELAELESRRDAAQLAIFEFREALAREELKKVKADIQKTRKLVNEALKERRGFQNGGRSKMIKAEGEAEADKKAIDLEAKMAKLQAQGQIAQRTLNRASQRWVVAREETNEIRKELEAEHNG